MVQRLLDAFIYRQAISQEVYQQQLDRLEGDLGVLRIDADTEASDQMDMEAVLQFAQQTVSNAVCTRSNG